MKKVEIRQFSHAEVDEPKETFGFLKIPINHTLIRAEGENLEVSDGYHSFDELYEHRFRLFIALCQYFIQGKASYDNRNVWISKTHHDGSNYEGWFIMGIAKEKGNQISYHLPISFWEECKKFAEEMERAPEWDGHTSQDVIQRLSKFYQ